MSCSALLVDTSGTAGARYGWVFKRELESAGEPVPPSLALEAVKTLDPDLLLIEVIALSAEVLREATGLVTSVFLKNFCKTHSNAL